MDLELKGKVAIITGASRGIGYAITERLAAEGMKVVIAARDETRLWGLAGEISARGGEALAYPGDLAEPKAPAALVAATVGRFGRVHLVVNNAGATKRGDFLTLTDADWTAGFGLKLFAAMRLCRAAWPHLVANGGAVINIAGIGGRTASMEFTIGGAVNAAMLNLTKSLADRGVHEGVRVNAINPGAIRTDRLTDRIKRLAGDQKISLEEAEFRMKKEMGVARFGEVQDIAEAVAFLASVRSSYVQGALIDVDGGMTRTL